MAEHKKENIEEKKSSKKLIIIIVAVVFLLAGVSGAGYFFFMRGHDAKEAGNDKDDKKGNHKEKKSKEKHEEDPESTDDEHGKAEKLYYDFGKPLVVDFSKSAAVRFVSISLSFLVEGADTVDGLKKNEPMIRNNLLMLINAQGVESLKTPAGKDKLRANILANVSGVLEKMTGKSHIKEIFFTSFVMQ
jgi:flagellar FliL protein